MADFGSMQASRNTSRQPISSFFSSPKLFTGFTPKGSSTDPSDSIMSSPTSILDTKQSNSTLRNPFWSDPNTPKTPKSEVKNLWEKFDGKGVGLGIIDSLVEDKQSDTVLLKSDSRMVLFGSHLKIQVPSLIPSTESPKSPSDFGIKTRNSHVGSFSPRFSPPKKSPFGSSGCFSSLSVSEIEMSEDYTCVISYGPNPKTTHIFDDCIVESCCGVVKFSESKKETAKETVNGFSANRPMSYPSDSFLSFCYACKKNLGQGKDIYMYRGEKAFCSSECRYNEMMLDEEMETDGVFSS